MRVNDIVRVVLPVLWNRLDPAAARVLLLFIQDRGLRGRVVRHTLLWRSRYTLELVGSRDSVRRVSEVLANLGI